MRATDFIAAKRRGEEHSKDTIHAFLHAYLHGDIADYQVAAWLMAVCFQGMTPQETANLTEVMAHSGDMLDLSSLAHTVDKHSTGGVGDKTSLVLAPLLAACGATVAKMSGRGLGHTGGTVDKLESIPGFQVSLDEGAFLQQARSLGVVISGQSKDLAPADGALYALRDATATVESLPLIASSIMSKKLAGGAQAIVLDVKVGSGAFMKTLDEARTLARAMVDIGERTGRRMRALLSNMSQPLGRAVGHALEVNEAVDTLQGKGPEDVRALCLALAAEVLTASGLDGSPERVSQVLDGGQAFEAFQAWIHAQGGDLRQLGKLELAPQQTPFTASADGYLSRLDALGVGQATHLLGGGRSKKGDTIDLGVGVVLHAKLGDRVSAKAPIATLYHRGERGLKDALEQLKQATELSPSAPTVPPLILETLP